MKIKRIIVLILCLVSMLLLVSCGDNDNKKGSTEATTENTTIENTEQSNNITTEEVPVTTEEVVTDEEGFVVVNDYYIVTEELINVLNKPSDYGDIYRLLMKDDVINRVGYKDNWYKVIVDNYEFYVEASGVSETTDPSGQGAQDEPNGEDGGDNTANNGTGEPTFVFDKSNKIIVIDAGNQMEGNETEESIGPESETMKASASSGSVGKITGKFEYDINLQIAQYLKAELVNRGYQVVMIREQNDVNISNKERAEKANSANGAVYIKLTLADSNDTSLSGPMAITMKSDSPYNSDCYSLSNRLASFILDGVVVATEGNNNGIIETNEMTSINWSDIPVTIINTGFISNAHEEEELVSEDYQRKIAKGIADGIDGYYQ